MKKLILPLFLLATMFACNAPEKKAEATASSDPKSGTFSSQDEKSAKVKELLEAYMKNDSTKIYEYYVDTVQIYDQMAANQEGGKTKANPGGRAGFAANERMNHDFYTNINVTTDNIMTLKFANGEEHTGVWCMWTGKGKFTNKEVSAPLHLAFIWQGDKIVREYRFFDPTTLYEEVAASQKK
ncbi:hypothetical protein ACMH5Q_05975 [Aquirufa lenticrescens]